MEEVRELLQAPLDALSDLRKTLLKRGTMQKTDMCNAVVADIAKIARSAMMRVLRAVTGGEAPEGEPAVELNCLCEQVHLPILSVCVRHTCFCYGRACLPVSLSSLCASGIT